ncbi:hypothetical protein B0H14DRAFT_2597432 [Mycena olivaceomarginata]|nr:hypothetical protein B0H14DRAFT_2597432 [Mycena olivaceomarginata]
MFQFCSILTPTAEVAEKALAWDPASKKIMVAIDSSYLQIMRNIKMTAGLDSLPLTIGALIGGYMTAIGSDVSLLPDIPDGHHTLQMSGDYLILCCGLRVLKILLLQVAWIWLTDTAHTITVCTLIWQYAVRNFTNPSSSLSKYNWWITGPIVCSGVRELDSFY